MYRKIGKDLMPGWKHGWEEFTTHLWHEEQFLQKEKKKKLFILKHKTEWNKFLQNMFLLITSIEKPFSRI